MSDRGQAAIAIVIWIITMIGLFMLVTKDANSQSCNKIITDENNIQYCVNPLKQ